MFLRKIVANFVGYDFIKFIDMKPVIFLMLVCSCLVSSCEKEIFTEGHSIVKIAESKPSDIQELTKARLLLAKIVSIAFGNSEFRQYFKTNFATKSKGGNYFEECLLIRHLDDKVLTDGTSLRGFLNKIRDDEVSSIISEPIVEYVLDIDEMVAIKLPDLFVNFEWNINEVIPVVIGTYPEQFSNANFIGYHYYNDSEFYITGNIPQVFHVYIKHSEDYILLDENDGSYFYEFLPQGNKCKELLNRVVDESDLYNGKRVVNLKSAYKLWFEICSFKGDYINTDDCDEVCQRNCSNPINYNIVLDHISINRPIFYLANSNLDYRESCTLYFQSRDLNQQINFQDFAVPNIRYAELGRLFRINKLSNKLRKIPKLSIEDDLSLNEIPYAIKYLMIDLPNTNLYYNLTLLQYGDSYYKIKLLDPNFENKFNPANALEVVTSFFLFSECIDANTNDHSGGINMNFRY